MTGAYVAVGETDRPRAREQVAAARRRASTRRTNVARSPHRRISGMLTVLVAFGVAFFLALAYSFDTDVFDEKSNSMMQVAVDEIMTDMMERGATESGYDLRLQRGAIGAEDWDVPTPAGSGSFIVLDDRTSLARGEQSLDSIIRSLVESGWTADDDLDLVAESAVAIARCHGKSGTDAGSVLDIDFHCDDLDRFPSGTRSGRDPLDHLHASGSRIYGGGRLDPVERRKHPGRLLPPTT